MDTYIRELAVTWPPSSDAVRAEAATALQGDGFLKLRVLGKRAFDKPPTEEEVIFHIDPAAHAASEDDEAAMPHPEDERSMTIRGIVKDTDFLIVVRLALNAEDPATASMVSPAPGH